MREPMTTERQEFFKEAYRRERVLTFAWHDRYKGKTTASSSSSSTTSTASQGTPTTTLQRRLSLPQLPVYASPSSASAGIRPATMAVEMVSTSSSFTATRPIPAEDKALLYTGVSSTGDGRAAYLRQRRLSSPEERYVYPQTASQAMTWQFAPGVLPPPTASPFGLRPVVRDTFYRKSGVF